MSRDPRGRADLHVHTTHSDGAYAPAEAVRAAASVGLRGLALTDHDTVTAYSAARAEADRLGLELISGVELTAALDGREVHILGYFFRPDDPDLRTVTDRIRIQRTERVAAMIDKLNDAGLRIELESLRRAFPRANLGRKHLADWLVRTGQVSGPREAFARYLEIGGAAFVEKPRLDWVEAIACLRAAGGIAALAHPRYDVTEATLGRLRDGGLDAVETDGPGIGSGFGPRLTAWAERLDLVPIAGSDFHAPDRPGRWIGAISTPWAQVERLRERRQCEPDRNLPPVSSIHSD